MWRRILIAAAVAMPGLLGACSDRSERGIMGSDAVRGSGVMATASRSVGAFDELVLSAVGDVNITFGGPQSVSVTVDDNIMPHLMTDLNAGRLLIGLEEDFSAVDYDLTVEVVMTEVESLILAGVGTITGQNLLQAEQVELILAGVGAIVVNVECNRLSTVMAGQGHLELAGSTAYHACVLAGLGNVRAFGLVADTSQMTLAGQGNIQVSTIDYLMAIISGIGNVSYRGRPNIVATITGTGDVIDAN